MPNRICNKCSLEKEIEQFAKVRSKYGRICKKCKYAQSRKWVIKNLDKVSERARAWTKTEKGKKSIRFRDIKKKYGLSKDEWLNMLSSQSKQCGICKESNNSLGFFYTDHCHSTGKIRGLLCKKCNSLLGFAKDSTEILMEAINYLDNSRRNL